MTRYYIDRIIECRVVMSEGDARPRVQLLQYFLFVISAFYDTVPAVDINGYFGPSTRVSIMEFQKTMKLPVTGIVDEQTWDYLYRSILGIIRTIPPTALIVPPSLLSITRFPGIVYRRGMGTEESGIFVIQELLAYISTRVPDITPVPYNLVDGVFGPITESAVVTFQKKYGLEPNGIVDETTWNRLVEVYAELRYGEIIKLGINSGNQYGRFFKCQ